MAYQKVKTIEKICACTPFYFPSAGTLWIDFIIYTKKTDKLIIKNNEDKYK